MSNKLLTREQARDVVLKAFRLLGTEHRGRTTIGDQDLGRYKVFHDVTTYHCDSCGEHNIGEDIIDVGKATEGGSFAATIRVMGYDDAAAEEADALCELMDALDSIGFHLTDPLHPTGKCRCAGEGTCKWCERNEERIKEQEEYDKSVEAEEPSPRRITLLLDVDLDDQGDWGVGVVPGSGDTLPPNDVLSTLLTYVAREYVERFGCAAEEGDDG